AAQQAAHRVPRPDEISPLVADHVDRRLQERGGGRPGFCERSEQIVCSAYRLSLHIARRDHVALWIERTSTGGEDELSADPAVLIRNSAPERHASTLPRARRAGGEARPPLPPSNRLARVVVELAEELPAVVGRHPLD